MRTRSLRKAEVIRRRPSQAQRRRTRVKTLSWRPHCSDHDSIVDRTIKPLIRLGLLELSPGADKRLLVTPRPETWDAFLTRAANIPISARTDAACGAHTGPLFHRHDVDGSCTLYFWTGQRKARLKRARSGLVTRSATFAVPMKGISVALRSQNLARHGVRSRRSARNSKKTLIWDTAAPLGQIAAQPA